MIKIEETERKCTVHVEGDMTIYNAKELMEALMPLLSTTNEFEINVGKVAEIDSAGIQILMMAKMEFADRDQPFSLTEHSPAVKDALELMDMSIYFGDAIVKQDEEGERHGA